MRVEKSVRAGLAATAAVLLLAAAHAAGAGEAGTAGNVAAVSGAPQAPHAPPAPLSDGRESHLADLLMLTHGGQNAEAYWSPDGRQLIFQSTRPPFECDQIFRLPPAGSGAPVLVSTGKGRTTCSYFMPDGQRVLYSSTHAAGDACPPAADRSRGYVWAVYPTYDIWTARPDGSDLRRLTDNHAYDAETTVCNRDGSLIFTSDRDGDLDLYRMDADGSHVRRLTSAPGYDGGAFFSPDCKKIVWGASRPQGTELEDYRRLLAQGLVRPGKLEIWVANADGSDARQLTYLDAASFAPSFFSSRDRVIFSSNYGDPQGREFELWAVNLDGSGLERITWSPGFDGFPMFSPDGTRLSFSSNRGQSRPHETNVFVARWVDRPAAAPAASATGPDGVLVAPLPADTLIAGRFRDEVRWLADPAREGRGIGSARLDAAAAAEVGAEVVAAGYGITSPELGVDDYRGVDARGKIVAVRRFTPRDGPLAAPEAARRFGDLRHKAYTAREHGARGLIVVDLPAPAAGLPDDAPLPLPEADAAAGAGDAGIPVVVVTRAAGARLFDAAAGAPPRRRAA